LVSIGEQVGIGSVLYAVDGEPIIALYGDTPAWRTMSVSSEVGADVRQLESSLVALGFDTDGAITVDDEFDASTRDAVKAWQTDLGVEVTGTVELGTVVFIPTEGIVSAALVRRGAIVDDGTAILTLGYPVDEVTATVPVELQGVVTPGTDVVVEDAGPGTVTRLLSIRGTSGVEVGAVITLDEPAEASSAASIRDIDIAVEVASDVLAVPAMALVSHLDGRYSIQVLAERGDARHVDVEPGATAGDLVEIVGPDVTEGDTVLVPG
jgi:peptidoglycan hydrolase-like protein with peptidoglycan-binding domain